MTKMNNNDTPSKYASRFRDDVVDFIESNYFQNEVIKIRKKFNIPKNGFKYNKTLKKGPGNEISINTIELKQTLSNNKMKEEDDLYEEIEKRMLKIVDDQPIYTDMLGLILSDYVLFSTLTDRSEEQLLYGAGYLSLVDLKLMLVRWDEDDLDKREKNRKEILREIDARPIAITMSPFIGQKQTYKFIRDMWMCIEDLQVFFGKEKSKKLGSSRTRNRSERNKFIYENWHKSDKNILKLVKEKFGSKDTPGLDEVSKIISLEKKRREQHHTKCDPYSS